MILNLKPNLIIAFFLFTVSLSSQSETLSFKSCTAIDDPVERLSCYDTLAGRLPADTTKASNTAPGVVDSMDPGADAISPANPAVTPAVTTVEPAPNAEATFGLKHKQKPKEEQLDELQLKWTQKKKDTYGKWVIILENGQVWHQTDSRRFNFVDPEQLVVIYRGALGSYFLGEPERRNGIRVERVK